MLGLAAPAVLDGLLPAPVVCPAPDVVCPAPTTELTLVQMFVTEEMSPAMSPTLGHLLRALSRSALLELYQLTASVDQEL